MNSWVTLDSWLNPYPVIYLARDIWHQKYDESHVNLDHSRFK